jgi:hypothetical protein
MPRLSIGDLLRGAKTGHSQAEYEGLLTSLGFEFVRNTRHGAKYSHKALREHPDAQTRAVKSWILVPVGRSLPEYVADDVLERYDLLRSLQQENPHAG